MAYDWRINPGKRYGELCAEVISLQGYKPGHVPIINRHKHEQNWRDWYAYYGFRRLEFCQELMRERDETTVPTWSPFDFDSEFNPKHPSPPVPRGDTAPAPRSRRDQPFERRIAKAKAENEHLPVLFENVDYDRWRRLSAGREVPVGAVWVACLGTVYGPRT